MIDKKNKVKKIPRSSASTMMHCSLCNGTEFQLLFHHHHDWSVQRCLSCHLVQVMPRPSVAEVTKLYDEDFSHFAPYIAQLPVHHAYFKEKMEDMVRYDIEKPKLKKTMRLLDIGCALGVLLKEAKALGFQATGIDISADAVKYCKKQSLDVLHGTMETLGKKLKKNSFIAITAFEIIEHESDPLSMMRHMYDLLQVGGVAVVTTPNHGSIYRKIMGKYWFGYQHPEHVFFFDPETLQKVAILAGFSEVEVRHDIPRPFPLSFAMTRSADYFPWLGWILKPLGKLFDRFDIKNPINPWDDLIVIARK